MKARLGWVGKWGDEEVFEDEGEGRVMREKVERGIGRGGVGWVFG